MVVFGVTHEKSQKTCFRFLVVVLVFWGGVLVLLWQCFVECFGTCLWIVFYVFESLGSLSA